MDFFRVIEKVENFKDGEFFIRKIWKFDKKAGESLDILFFVVTLYR